MPKKTPSAAPYTAFGKSRLIPIKVWRDGNYLEDENDWHKTLWVERGEDWYALHSPQYRGLKVRIIERSVWLAAEDMEVVDG
jgi:hypothetical protein